MKIRLEHQNIGAAVMQIAEHPQFTAINAFEIGGNAINNAFLVNSDIVVFCKYSSETNSVGEYVFTFNNEHMGNIAVAKKNYQNVFLGLVCVKDGEICCLSGSQFDTLINNRKKSAKIGEDQYQILVTAKQGASFRAYINAASKKGKTAGKMLTIARKAFPDTIFD